MCEHDTSCNQTETIKELYHDIPSEIHTNYIENIQVQNVINNNERMFNVILINSQNIELIAYPHKSEYDDEPVLSKLVIEPMNSKSHSRVKFDPDVLNLGYRYL